MTTLRYLAGWLWHAFFGALARICFRLGGERGTLPTDVMEPLTAAELEEIAAFLRQTNAHDGYLADLYALDGFLTCVVIGPEPISPGEWLPALFGGRLPATGSPGQLDRQMQLITRRMNMIAAQFIQPPPAYQPLFETHPGLGRHLPPLDAWCQGFMTATMLRDAQWETLLQRSEAVRWLYPIWERASVSADKPAGKRPAGRKAREKGGFTAAQLRTAVLGIRAHWAG